MNGMTGARKSILIAIFSAVLMLSVLGIGASAAGSAEKNAQARAQEDTVYELGEKIDIPPRTLYDGEKGYPSQIVVYYPDKSAYLESSPVLDQLGRYIVEYRAVTESGKRLSERYSFETQTDLYQFSGEKSYAVYGEDRSDYKTGKTGLAISLAQGETFRYNEPVNLRELGAGSTFIELFALPSKGAGVRDAGAIVITLEDVNDPKNKVTIYGRSVDSDGGGDPWWCNTTYLSAGAAGQTPTGIEWGPPIKIHTSKFGFPVAYSLYGYRNFENSVGKENFGLKIDLDEKRIYGIQNSGEDYVIDLDEKKYFANLWEGFSTDEVYISVAAENYYSETFDFMITKIGDSDLGAQTLRDVRPPKITILSEGYDTENLPAASVGTPYPVFAATASDACAPSLPVTVKVFYNYTSTTRYELPVEGGMFTPDRTGEYAIEYTAQDYYGNTASAVSRVQCISESQPIVIQIRDGAQKTGVVGQRIEADAFAVNGGIGRLEREVSVLFGGIEVGMEDGGFLPMQAGRYTVRCTVSDMTGRQTAEEYAVEVAMNQNPVFLEDAALPVCFIEGVSYSLPELRAYCFAEEKWTESDIRITDGAGAGEPQDGRYVFHADDEGFATVTYVASSATGEAQKTYRIPVVKAYSGKEIDASAMFVTENAEKTVLYTGVRFTQSGSMAMRAAFAVPQNAEQTSVNFSADGTDGSLRIKLADVAAAACSIDIELRYAGAYYKVFVGGADINLSVKCASAVSLVYERGEGRLLINGNACDIPDPGFGTQGIEISFSMDGTQSQFTVQSIGGQSLAKGMTDGTAPGLALEGEYDRSYPLNASISTLIGRAFDAMSPGSTALISLYAPDGRAVMAEDGVRISGLDAGKAYTAVLEEYGQYRAVYEVSDIFGNTKQYTYAFDIADSIAPIIQLLHENKTQYRAGDTVRFSKATAEDDHDAECEVRYFIVDPKGVITASDWAKTSETETELAFLANRSGTYIVRYLAVDLAGNVSIYDERIAVD